MSLVAKRQEGETWRQAVERIAKPHRMDRECLDEFDANIAVGIPEDRAAWNALYEWDCLDYVED